MFYIYIYTCIIENFLMDVAPLALRVDAHPRSHGDVPGDPPTLNPKRRGAFCD